MELREGRREGDMAVEREREVDAPRLVGPRNAQYAVAIGAQDIRDTIVIKHQDLFLLSDLTGNVPRDNPNGLGLYYEDTRFLSTYELVLEGFPPTFLLSTGEMRFAEVQELTNPDLRLPNGSLIPKESITFHRERVISEATIYEILSVTNFNVTPVPLELVIFFDADFLDMFQIRGFVSGERRGVLRPPTWNENRLQFSYEGIDGVSRFTQIEFSPSPLLASGGRAVFDLDLTPKASTTLQLEISVGYDKTPGAGRLGSSPLHGLAALVESNAESYDRWIQRSPSVQSDNPIWNDLIDGSRRDLRLLDCGADDVSYPAAGIPWFATLFGRDSLLTALENIWDCQQAAGILRLLGSLQGKADNPWRDEQPGKIPHELRRGELARCNIVPFNPYYGTVDATPLFVVLLAEYFRATGDVVLARQLEPNLRAALEWMELYGDLDGDGFIEYQRQSASGLTNQGWKDSFDAIMYRSGELIRPPVALVEVQAYAYAARRGASTIYRALGDESEASRQEFIAQWLKAEFNRRFWLEAEGTYCLALDGDKKPADVISSNAGHALWCGIVPPDRAGRLADRLMRADVFTGWGVRTLASGEVRFNPMGYHVGTVWPHDNALFAAGLKRYGEDDHFRQVISGFFESARHFPDLRIPELFCGYDRAQYRVPVRYPVACSPQAWSAAAPLLFLRALLGIVPDAPHNELWIVRPQLPEWLHVISVDNLHVGSSVVDLRYEREGDHTLTDVARIEGGLRVVFVDRWPAL
jgi:glycogen debranching enzyme